MKTKQPEIKLDTDIESFLKPNTISIDFDGVIHKYSKGWIGPEIYDDPVEGAHEALFELHKKFNIFILTCRAVPGIVQWMNTTFWQGKEPTFITVPMPEGRIFWDGEMIGFDNQKIVAVTNKKISAKYYIDDRAIRFDNWKGTMENLRFFEQEEGFRDNEY